MSEQIVRPDQGAPVQASPTEVIEMAKAQADAMMALVEDRRLYQMIAGRKFLQVEAWQLLASFHGLTPVITETRPFSLGDVQGWEARCELKDRQGNVVAAAEAVCANDEPNWRGKPTYQLRSMAQTRAVSKAIRTKLSFIAVLAGYEPTPAEEMDGVEIQTGKPQAQQAQPQIPPRPKVETTTFNEFEAYDKCCQRFGKDLIDHILEQEYAGALPESRQAWVRIWNIAKNTAMEDTGKEGNDDRPTGVSLYPR